MEINKNIKWSENLEKFFKDTGEMCFCYSYLHKKAESKFNKFNNFLSIPAIILSSVAGTLSIGSGTIFEGMETSGSLGIGILSILISIMNTINSYFGFGKRSENHKLVSIQYGKLYRFIKIELNLPRNERMKTNDFLKIVNEQYERLAELSELIPYNIIESFKHKFKEYQVTKPPECNGLEKIEIYESINEDSINNIIKIEKEKSENLISDSEENIISV